MASKDISNGTSHKRTSSTAGNTTTAPEPKRQAQERQVVYLVWEERTSPYTDTALGIRGVYADLKDANNAMVRFVSEEFAGAEEVERGIDKDGKRHWSSGETGEGEGASYMIEEQVVKRPGCEADRDWGDDENDEGEGEGDDDEE